MKACSTSRVNRAQWEYTTDIATISLCKNRISTGSLFEMFYFCSSWCPCTVKWAVSFSREVRRSFLETTKRLPTMLASEGTSNFATGFTPLFHRIPSYSFCLPSLNRQSLGSSLTCASYFDSSSSGLRSVEMGALLRR